jgi:hypothetical protein
MQWPSSFHGPMPKIFTPNPYAEAVILARQQAHRIIIRKIRAQGHPPLSTLSAAVLSRLAIELVEQCPKLVADQLANA